MPLLREEDCVVRMGILKNCLPRHHLNGQFLDVPNSFSLVRMGSTKIKYE